MKELRWFPAEPLPKYPHLRPFESEIWERFISSRPKGILEVAFDVTVGDGRAILPGVPKYQARNWGYLTKFKIDVFARCDFGFWLFEIKNQVNAGAFGQLLVYDLLMFKSSPGMRPALKTLLCHQAHPDLYYAASRLGVQIIDVDNL
jgi:hypothetical protein